MEEFFHRFCVARYASISWAFLLPARRYASAGNSHCNVSVRPSVTRWYCIKMKKASGMISSPSASPKTLVFWRQISSPNSKGFPLSGASNKESVKKIERFSSFKRQYLENGSRYGQLLLVTNRKSQVSFRLTPRSMTLGDLELYKLCISLNFQRISRDFADFGRNNS